MDWDNIGIGVAAASALLGANAFLTRMVVRTAILELNKVILQEFVTRREFDAHTSNCPAVRKEKP